MLTNVKERASNRERLSQSLQRVVAQLVPQQLSHVEVQFDLDFWDAKAENLVPVDIGLWVEAGRTRRLIIVEGWQRNQAINAMFVRAVAKKCALSQAYRAIIVARKVPTRAAINVARELGIHILIWKQAHAPA
ncbi:MAG: hypothetical protein ACE5H9_01780 [Anaerolineae bacterium]